MIRVRLVYPEEFIAFRRLFYLTERRNLSEDDYVLEDNYIQFKPNISLQLERILQRIEIESIWAPLWVEGLARGFFSNQADTAARLAGLNTIPEINWSFIYGQVVFVDRNQYKEAKDLAERFRSDWIFLQGVSWKRVVVGGMSGQEAVDDFRRVPKGIDVRAIESYLIDDIGFIVEYTNLSQLQNEIVANYLATRSRRVPGGREPHPFADLGWAISLDSFDELQTLLNSELRQLVPRGVPLHFPHNPTLSEENNKIWELPIAVGDEDIHLELSYYRDSGQIDPQYAKYRETHILNLEPASKIYLMSYLEE